MATAAMDVKTAASKRKAWEAAAMSSKRPENQEIGYDGRKIKKEDMELRVVKKGEWKGRIYREGLKEEEMGIGQNGKIKRVKCCLKLGW